MKKEERFEMVRKIRLSQADVKNIVKSDREDFAEYPWDECVADQIVRYGDEETAKKVCGAIKAGMKKAFQEGDDLANACWPGYEAIGLKEGPDGRMVPNCVPVKEGMSKEKSGYTEPSSKTNGSNFNKNIVKEGFPIPSPSGDESESDYVSRCMKEIGSEYEQEQALAICYNTYREK